jgi:hypothetical protein
MMRLGCHCWLAPDILRVVAQQRKARRIVKKPEKAFCMLWKPYLQYDLEMFALPYTKVRGGRKKRRNSEQGEEEGDFRIGSDMSVSWRWWRCRQWTSGYTS